MSDPRLPTLTDETTIVARTSIDVDVEPGDAQDGMLERWEAGQRCLFDGLSPLTMTDGSRILSTWGEPPPVTQTISRQLARHAYCAGQIVPPEEQRTAGTGRPLSIPREQSEAFNAVMRK